MDTSELLIRRDGAKEGLFSTFFIGWGACLSTLRLYFKQTLFPVLGQLFGIFLISLAPILEYREFINIFETPDGWIYIGLSLSGIIFFVYFLWKFFVTLAGVNLLARDIYDNRAIANLSFYTSDIIRKKWSYIRFLIVYTLIALIFTASMSGILFLQRNLVTYDVWTNLASIGLLLVQTFILLAYILFSNIALQGYAYNRIIGLWRTLGKICHFIIDNFTGLTLLSLLTVAFSNIVAYIVQALLTFLIINPLAWQVDDSTTVATRFVVGFIINAFVVVFLQYVFSRFYLVCEKDSLKMF